MEIFNCLFFGFISMVLGGLFTKIDPVTGEPENAVPRWISLSAIFIVLGLQFYAEPVLFLAYLWCFYCFRLLPTSSLLSAVHGYKPTRDDGRWDWMQDLAMMIRGWLPLLPINYYAFGIIYGFLRASLAIPAIIVTGNWYFLGFLFIGIFYYIGGYIGRKYNGKDNVRYVEGFIGFLFALCLPYN